MDFGILLLIAFFVWLAWLLLRDKPQPPAVCVACGHYGPARTNTRGSILIEVILWLCFIIPGLIYSVWRHSTRKPMCTSCGSEQLVPPGSPMGKKFIAEYSPETASAERRVEQQRQQRAEGWGRSIARLFRR